MPIMPNFFERLLMKFNVVPAAAFETGVYWTLSKVLITATKLNLFDAIDKEEKTIQELSSELELSENGLNSFLQVLLAANYVTKKGNRYMATKYASKWLTSSSPSSIRDLVLFNDDNYERAVTLEETLRLGKPAKTGWEWRAEKDGRYARAQANWKNLAVHAGGEIAKRCAIEEKHKRIIDVGGGHGLFVIHFCKIYPWLQGVVYDWPEGTKAGKESIKEYGLEDRVSTVDGDLNKDELGTGYDIALVFNIIHGHTDNDELMDKVYRSLNPGGKVIVMDYVQSKYPKGVVGLISPTIGIDFFIDSGGKIYSVGEVKSLMEKHNFVYDKSFMLKHSLGMGVIIGTKPE